MILDKYPNLLRACGGDITPETLTTFEQAMREYDACTKMLCAFFRPVDRQHDGSDEPATETRSEARRTP